MPDTATTLPDYYEALQVSPNADAEFIQAAYKRLVEKWHADRRPGDTTAFERLANLDEAYAVLIDPVKRRAYDSRRTQHETAEVEQEIVSQAKVESHPDPRPATRWPWWLATALVLTAILGLIFAGKEEPHSASSKEESTVAILDRLEGGTDGKKEFRDDGHSTPLTPDVLFARISPAVVQIVTFDRSGRAVGSGSGFLVNKHGLIATNYHVIEKAHSAQVVIEDGKTLPVLGVAVLDIEADIAIIKVASPTGTQPLELATGELPIGAKVYAIGNPLGLANTLSEGLVSGYREIDKARVIQTTAPISPGSSGGPLLGADGKVVGVTTFLFKGGQNLNFAVPASQVSRLLSQCKIEGNLNTLPLARNPAARSCIERGIAWFEKGEYDKAVKEFDEAIRIDPRDSIAYCNRGMVFLYGMKDYDKAIIDCNNAILIDSDCIDAFNNRGQAWKGKNEFVKAIADYSEAIRLDPTSCGAFAIRGSVYALKKEYDKAIKDFNEAVRLEPNMAFCFIDRGSTWYMLKEYDQAIKDLSEAIRLDSTIARAYFWRGNAWSRKGEFDKAIENYDEALRLDPNHKFAKSARDTVLRERAAQRKK